MKKVPCPICGKEIDVEDLKAAKEHMQIDKEHQRFYLRSRIAAINDMVRKTNMALVPNF